MKDEGMTEIRAIRHQISDEYGHNIQEYINYLQSQDEQYADQIALARKLLLDQEQEESKKTLQKVA